MLTRLTNFKTHHKDRARKDRQRIDWREEDRHLRRASQELTKAIQAESMYTISRAVAVLNSVIGSFVAISRGDDV